MGLRRLPKDVRRALSARMKDEVATPLASRIAAAAAGPWAGALRAGTKARAGADPTIAVGGMSPKMRGGAGPRNVVFGAEFGGGKRLAKVTEYQRGGRRAGKVRGHRRYATRQFAHNKDPFIFDTVAANMDKTMDAIATIVLEVMAEDTPGG